jgi:hypothetical protein
VWPAVAVGAIATCLLEGILGVLLLARHLPCFNDAVVAPDVLVIVGACLLVTDPAVKAGILFSRFTLWQRHRRRAAHAAGEVCEQTSQEAPVRLSPEIVSLDHLNITADDRKKARLVHTVRALLNHHLQQQTRPLLTQLTLEQTTRLDQHSSHIASQIEDIIAGLKSDSEYPWMNDLESFLLRSPSPARSGSRLEGSINLGEAIAKQAFSPQEKVLKLSDSEILNLCDSAKHEAQAEADWRGIQWPHTVSERRLDTLDEHPRTPCHSPFSHDACRSTENVDEYLWILSIATETRSLELPDSCFQVLEKALEDSPVVTEAVDANTRAWCHSSSGISDTRSHHSVRRPLQRPPSPVAPPLLP